MKVDGPELLLTIEGTLVDFLPLPRTLALLSDVDVIGHHLDGWAHGQELDWHDAWAVLRHPDFRNGWRIVPLQGGRLVLGHVAALPDPHIQAADLWQERAVGVMALSGEMPVGSLIG